MPEQLRALAEVVRHDLHRVRARLPRIRTTLRRDGGDDLQRGFVRAGSAPMHGAAPPWSSERTRLARAGDMASALLFAPVLSRALSIDGRETRVALSASDGAGALVYAVAPAAGTEPLLVATFPVREHAAILDRFAPRLQWNAD